MGYELHITRADFFAENEGNAISENEWRTLVKSDAELRLAGDNGPNFVLWTAHPTGAEAWLDWDQGNVSTKNPDDALVGKMLEIAERLQAKVQGDDGETYPLANPAQTGFWETKAGGASLLAVVIGVACLSFAFSIDVRWQEQQAGEPRPLPDAIMLLLLALPGLAGWLGGTIVSLLALLGKPSNRRAWCALGISVGFTVYLIFSR